MSNAAVVAGLKALGRPSKDARKTMGEVSGKSLGSLWVRAKLSPHLATPGHRLGAALTRLLSRALPSARTPDQYRAAIDAMLAALADADSSCLLRDRLPL